VPQSCCVFGEAALFVAVCPVSLVVSLVRSIGICRAWCVFVWVLPIGGGAVVGMGVADGFCVVFGSAIQTICMMSPNLFIAHW